MGFSHLFRRGRGLWITPDHKGRIFEILGHVRNEDVKLIVVTDNERILGLGDQGVGGMVIPIGKLALYTLGAGIHPAYTLPISLDVGTDNERLLNDDTVCWLACPALRGDEYYELIDEFVEAVARRLPDVLLQWEDFKKANAFRCSTGTARRCLASTTTSRGPPPSWGPAVLAFCRATGTKLADQRILLVGAGAAGVGIAPPPPSRTRDHGRGGGEPIPALSPCWIRPVWSPSTAPRWMITREVLLGRRNWHIKRGSTVPLAWPTLSMRSTRP